MKTISNNANIPMLKKLLLKLSLEKTCGCDLQKEINPQIKKIAKRINKNLPQNIFVSSDLCFALQTRNRIYRSLGTRWNSSINSAKCSKRNPGNKKS
jgi:hypothetical protein